MAKKETRQIAVIGSGNWGKNLIRNFFELGTLKVIADKNAASLKEMSKLFPACETASSLQDVLARTDIAGVAIATPAETHFTLARKALLARKHVFVAPP